MNRKRIIQHWTAVACLVAAVLAFLGSFFSGTGRSDVETAAQEMGRKVEKRIQILDTYIEKALEGDPKSWMDLEKLPEDMVVYRYVNDTLQSWANQFPIFVDNKLDGELIGIIISLFRMESATEFTKESF